MMGTLSVLILAARPKTLTAGAVPVLAATCLACADGVPVQTWILVCALCAALLIQIATNFINDAWDFKKGTDTEHRLGPPRATQLGLIAPEPLLRIAGIVLAIALFLGIPLVIHGGLPVLLIGLASLFFAWAYTAGPYPLAYHGLGEIFVLVFFGFIAVGGTYFLYANTVTVNTLLLGSQIGILSVLIIAINNLRDIEGDARSNKRTLAVIFGKPAAKMLICLFSLLPLVLGFGWLPAYPLAAACPLIALPLGVHIAKSVYSLEPGSAFNKLLGKSALLHALFGGIISAALLWS